MKKLAVIGKGTAGALSAMHFAKWAQDTEIAWYFDPETPTQAVGEGSTLRLPMNLFQCTNFSYVDMERIQGSVKTGILKTDWGNENRSFFHWFTAPNVGLHFCATDLQDFILEKLRSSVSVIEQKVSHEDIDADFIMDCTGKPATMDGFVESEYICVNSVYVIQCPWDFPKFTHTVAAARPHGWVFCIPLKNRCSVGYLYNSSISTLDEVREDVTAILEEYALTPSEKTNAFSFKSYKRSQNFTSRVAYNGNASFFLEPMEATSIGVMDAVQREAYDVWYRGKSVSKANEVYDVLLRQIETFIMMHYYAGSTFNSAFWDFARERGDKAMQAAAKNDVMFYSMCKRGAAVKDFTAALTGADYGQWWVGSFTQHIRGFGLEHRLKELFTSHGRDWGAPDAG